MTAEDAEDIVYGVNSHEFRVTSETEEGQWVWCHSCCRARVVDPDDDIADQLPSECYPDRETDTTEQERLVEHDGREPTKLTGLKLTYGVSHAMDTSWWDELNHPRAWLAPEPAAGRMAYNSTKRAVCRVVEDSPEQEPIEPPEETPDVLDQSGPDHEQAGLDDLVGGASA